jgi:hypothetical protein
MSISYEAIYTWIYALPKGELAAAEIVLRTGRARRQPRGRARSKGARIVGMVSISQRPEEAEGRKVPGHWEGDLVIGKAGIPRWGRWWSARAVTLSLLRCRTAGIPARSARALSSPCGICPRTCSGRSPGTRASRWPSTPLSPSRPISRCISRTRTRRGSGNQ